jgi:pseudaminic acid synthase
MEIKIGNRSIGNDHPTFIIAELSCNHLRDFDLTINTIKAMKEAGADAVKIQTFRPDGVTLDSDKAHFIINQGSIWDGQNFYKLYDTLWMPWEWQPKLKKVVEDLGMEFFSSPFDNSAVDFLEQMGVPAYKVASFEITDIPFIEYIASKGNPVIISTGIATLSDIEDAINACQATNNDQVALLKCTSAYPAPFEEMNLKTIPNLGDTFHTVVGLSDHSPGSTVPVASVALGARIIEKHFILDRNLGGADSTFSMEPDEFKQMVDAVRNTEKALGKITYTLSPKIIKSREFSRSLFAVTDIREGDIFTNENIRSLRPGFGLHPKFIKNLLGRKASHNIEKGTPLNWDII